jgi:hypothetical protein
MFGLGRFFRKQLPFSFLMFLCSRELVWIVHEIRCEMIECRSSTVKMWFEMKVATPEAVRDFRLGGRQSPTRAEMQ